MDVKPCSLVQTLAWNLKMLLNLLKEETVPYIRTDTLANQFRPILVQISCKEKSSEAKNVCTKKFVMYL